MPAVWGTTRVLGVIGWPVRHSFSPPMHNAAIEALGLDLVYVPFEIAPADLPAAVAGLRAAGVVGFNATIPHKEALGPLLDCLTPEAELTGTVNTVHFTSEGAVGDSTDGPGFVSGLAAHGCDVAGSDVVVLGAGGSARAIGVSLARSGAARLTLVNRTLERAEALAELLNERVRPDVARALPLDHPAVAGELARAGLIVNTTSVGMAKADGPENEAARQPVALPDLQPGVWVVDIIYNPFTTPLLEAAAARGARVLNGVEMLVRQGALSLARWTGCEPPVERMREVLVAELRRRAGGR